MSESVYHAMERLDEALGPPESPGTPADPYRAIVDEAIKRLADRDALAAKLREAETVIGQCVRATTDIRFGGPGYRAEVNRIAELREHVDATAAALASERTARLAAERERDEARHAVERLRGEMASWKAARCVHCGALISAHDGAGCPTDECRKERELADRLGAAGRTALNALEPGDPAGEALAVELDALAARREAK